MARDECKCTECGKQGQWIQEGVIPPLVRIEAHHIVSINYLIRRYGIEKAEEALDFPEFFDIDNGRTLCTDCHLEIEPRGTRIFDRTKPTPDPTPPVAQ